MSFREAMYGDIVARLFEAVEWCCKPRLWRQRAISYLRECLPASCKHLLELLTDEIIVSTAVTSVTSRLLLPRVRGTDV